MPSPRRLVLLMVGNILVLVLMLAAMELAYRVYRDGVPQAFVNIANYFSDVPYSDLGTGNWLVNDEVIGFRLNPATPGVNSLSIRHPEVTIPKPPGVKRVIVLGDSLPYHPQGFPVQLGKLLAHDGSIEVINASVPGYTTYQELQFLKKNLLKTAPDLVVLSYCLNDNHRFLHTFDAKARALWTHEAMDRLAVQTPMDWLVSRSYLLSRIKLGMVALQRQRAHEETPYPWDTMEDFASAWEDDSWGPQEEYLREMRDVLADVGSRFVVVVFPFEPQLREEALQADYGYVSKPQTMLMKICGSLGIPCLDLFEDFRVAKTEGAANYLPDGVHLSAAGHQFAAERIESFLTAQGLHPSG